MDQNPHCPLVKNNSIKSNKSSKLEMRLLKNKYILNKSIGLLEILFLGLLEILCKNATTLEQ